MIVDDRSEHVHITEQFIYLIITVFKKLTVYGLYYK